MHLGKAIHLWGRRVPGSEEVTFSHLSVPHCEGVLRCWVSCFPSSQWGHASGSCTSCHLRSVSFSGCSLVDP